MTQAKSRYILDGVVPILQTPFHGDGSLDPAGLARLAEHAVRQGAAGVIYPAVASEASKLSLDERRMMLEVVLDAVQGRVPAVVGVSAGALEDCLALARHAQARGAAGMLAQAPAAVAGNGERTRDFFRRLAQGADLMLMIQDLDWHGDGMDPELICDLFDELPAFRCIKVETAPAGPKYSRLLAATDGRLHVSGGWAVTQMLDGLERGVHAFMPEGSMVAVYRRIMTRFAAGDRDGARDLFERLLPVLAFANQHMDVSIQFFKRVLVAKGIFRSSAVRDPIRPLDALQERTAAALASRVLELERSLDRAGGRVDAREPDRGGGLDSRNWTG